MTVRTRVAPSPTGYLHNGGVRTAPRWSVMAILLACGGCTEKRPFDVEHAFKATNHHRLTIDGITYSYFGWYGKKDREMFFSFIVVFPSDEQHVFGGIDVSRDVGMGYHSPLSVVHRPSRIWYYSIGDGKNTGLDFCYVYFIKDDQIVFRKSYKELGIDLSNPENTFNWNHLQPILEQLVREHVNPQEPEMEEPHHANP